MSDLKKKITQINEVVRRKLDISRDEYALCAYILYRSADPRNKLSGWCEDKKDLLAEFIGITRPGLYKMIQRLETKGLIEHGGVGAYRVTALWIDEDSECKQSLQRSVKKVDTDSKQSLQRSVKKVDTNYSIKVLGRDKKEEGEKNGANAPSPAPEKTKPVKAEKAPNPNSAAPIPPSWNDRPNTDTPAKMVADLRAFYATNLDDFRVMCDTARVRYSYEDMTEIIAAFCGHRIENNRTADTYRQIHGALQKWLIGEKIMRKKPAAASAPAEIQYKKKPMMY